MRIPRHRTITAGEALYQRLREWLLRHQSEQDSHTWIATLRFSAEWSEFFEQAMAMSLTGRVVRAGRGLQKLHNVDQKLFEREFRSYLNEELGASKDDLNVFVRMGVEGVSASQKSISNGTAKRMRVWAQEAHSYCYICGCTLDFMAGAQGAEGYSLEHIWPRSFGGDSITENLLPACRACNGERKQDFATWALTSIQSVNLNMNPSVGELRRIEGPIKYALHQRAALDFAVKNSLTLKEALMKLGTWTDVSVLDTNDVGHFFNLRNHNISVIS